MAQNRRTIRGNYRGNTALDCNGIYSNNNGDVAANDRSVKKPGQMGDGNGGGQPGEGWQDDTNEG